MKVKIKVKITKSGHGFKAGEQKEIPLALAANLMASNSADEVGTKNIPPVEMASLSRRQLAGVARCRNIEGYLGMNQGQLIEALVLKSAGTAKK